VFDTATNTVIATIPVGSFPIGVAVTPDGSAVYVAKQATVSTVSVIATTTNTVTATIPVGFLPFGVAVTPDGSKVYVTNYGGVGGTVSVIETASNTVIGSPIPVGGFPYGVAVTPDGSEVYVVNANDNTVSVIETASNTVIGSPIPVGSFLGAFGKFIGPAPAVALTSGKHCDGVFTGDFDGNIRVSAGQSCFFVPPCEIEGRVTLDGGTFNLACTLKGNIVQEDGNLMLRQKARVDGTVQISGTSAFTLSTGAAIRGDLHIRNLAAGLPQGTVCGTKVGRMLIKNNASSMEIGGPNGQICAGNDIARDLQADNNSGELSIDYNHIGGDLQVNDNSGSTDVSDNTVGDDMRCRDNASVTHTALNMVRGKARGQCAAFP
jgi:YVTN family beta-propeller protein